MITKAQYNEARTKALGYFKKAGIAITPDEVERLEVADAGLGDLWNVGLVILTYVNTERVCAKELICLPNQMFVEHWHPAVKGQIGKEETFRCRWGVFYLYVPGEPTPNPKATPPAARRPWLSVWHEVILKPGEQYTLPPNTKHWFQAGPEGAVVSEFSTHSDDESDIFSDPNVTRIPVIEG
jgi:D-lyxose ketol-isomerase